MKLIALDLDGTLLNSEKVISAGNFAALSLAAEQGHVIVPATGRALRGAGDGAAVSAVCYYDQRREGFRHADGGDAPAC